jgi:NTP pyrophosphatase (non-canonical NTP hydrolase)
MQYTKIEHEELYKKLIDLNGVEDQLGYFYEEVGELLQAINHYKRGRCSLFKVINELVDVQIVLDILKVAYNLSYENNTDITFVKIEKIKKYVEQLEKEKELNKLMDIIK